MQQIQRRTAPLRQRTEEAVPQKRKNMTNIFFGIFFVVIAVYFVGYLFTHVFSANIDQVQIQPAYMGVPTVFDGLIVRDEIVLNATSDGELTLYVQNHTRVRAGTILGSVRQSAATSYFDAAEQAVQAAVLRGQATGLAAGNIEIAGSYERMDALLGNLGFDTAGNIYELQDLAFLMNQEITRRNGLYIANDASLYSELTATETVLSAMSNDIVTTRAGLVSIYLDGLEAAMTVDNFASLPLSAFGQSDNFASQRQVSRGHGALRLVLSNDWYIASLIPRKYAEAWHIESQITIFVEQVDGNLPLWVDVYRLIDQGSHFYVIFRTNFETLRFVDQRNISFQLAESPGVGLQIPQNAIVERSIFPIPRDFAIMDYEMMTVTRTDGQVMPVSGWISNDGSTFYVLADGSGLRTGDAIVHEDEEFVLDFISVVQGVFVSNRGHSLFRQIHLPENYNNDSDYIVLNPIENPHIQMFDWVVADARDAQNRLLLN